MPNHEIVLIPRPLTGAFLAELEARHLVKTLRPTEPIRDNPESDMDQPLYISDPAYGGHKLLCVRKNVHRITLWAHSDNEDVIFLKKPERVYKPLYLILGLHKEEEFSRRARQGRLTPGDAVALEVPFNDPATCVFTVLKGTPHCEVTPPGPGEAPVFYVTEPSAMDMYAVDVAGVSFVLAG